MNNKLELKFLRKNNLNHKWLKHFAKYDNWVDWYTSEWNSTRN